MTGDSRETRHSSHRRIHFKNQLYWSAQASKLLNSNALNYLPDVIHACLSNPVRLVSTSPPSQFTQLSLSELCPFPQHPTNDKVYKQSSSVRRTVL